MSNRIIFGTVNGLTGYTPAVAIDATNDYWLLQQGGVYKSINRSVALGITGSPVGTSDTQTLTNKTLDNTNTLTIRRDRFTLQDNADTTKQANFILSGITTGTTRSYTLPNASVTLADTSSTQTLTGKTLTSPTITGGTYDNGTITIDSISGHTTSTIVTVGGVQLNNGTIGTSNAVTTASIVDSAVTPAKLLMGTGSGWSFSAFIPTWTGLTVGNGTNASKYIQIGKTLVVIYDFSLGSTSAVTGQIIASFPVTAVSRGTSSKIGDGLFINTGVGEYPLVAEFASTTTTAFLAVNTAATYAVLTASSSTAPFTFVNGSRISATLILEAA